MDYELKQAIKNASKRAKELDFVSGYDGINPELLGKTLIDVMINMGNVTREADRLQVGDEELWYCFCYQLDCLRNN